MSEETAPTWHHDAGHAWLQVPLSLVETAPSQFSYLDSKFAYLEEDCDAPKWIKDVAGKHGDPMLWLEVSDGDWSWIRELNRFGERNA
jgi:hypothetical protein